MTGAIQPGSVRRGVVVGVVLLVLAGSLATAPVAATTIPEAEPNDSQDSAQSITTGEEVTGEVGTNDQDWFAFEAERGETINVTMTAGSDGETALALVGPDGDSITNTFLTGETKFVGTNVRTSGTYYVRASPASGFDQGTTYEFTVETYASDEFEPNEDRGNATSIEVNSTQSGEVTVGDRDWFAFEVPRGVDINVTTTAGSNGETDVSIRGPDGESFNNTFVFGGTKSVTHTTRTGGTYYVRAAPASGFNHGTTYEFTLEVAPNATIEPRPTTVGGSEPTPTVADGGDEPTTTSGGGGPGFGVLVALFALLGSAALARRQ